MIYSLASSKSTALSPPQDFYLFLWHLCLVNSNILQISPEEEASGNVRQRPAEPEVILLVQGARFHSLIVRLSGFLALLHNYSETQGGVALFTHFHFLSSPAVSEDKISILT